MRSNFSVGDVEAFVAVANHLSFRAAAETLNISASALSRRIRKLETRLGTQLLVRTTREVKMTPAGTQICLRAQDVLADVETLLTVGGKRGRYVPHVTIACTNSHAQVVMPGAVARFGEEFPDTPVHVLGLSAAEILQAVRRGEADFGIADLGLQESGLDFHPIFTERIVLAVPRNHRLAVNREVKWDQLSKERFIAVWKGAPIRVLMDFELAKARKSVSIFHEVRNQHTALGFVAAGLGVSAATELAVTTFSRDLRGVPLVAPAIQCPRALVRARGRIMRPGARAFWEVLRAQWRHSAG